MEEKTSDCSSSSLAFTLVYFFCLFLLYVRTFSVAQSNAQESRRGREAGENFHSACQGYYRGSQTRGRGSCYE